MYMSCRCILSLCLVSTGMFAAELLDQRIAEVRTQFGDVRTEMLEVLAIAKCSIEELQAELEKTPRDQTTTRRNIRMGLCRHLKIGDDEQKAHALLGQPLERIGNVEYYPDGVGLLYLPIEGVRRYVDANIYVLDGLERRGPAFVPPIPCPALVRIGLPRSEVEKHFRMPHYSIGNCVIYDTAIIRYENDIVAEVRPPLHGAVFINSDMRTSRKRFADALEKIKPGDSRAAIQESLILISEANREVEFYWPDKQGYSRSFGFAFRLEFRNNVLASVELWRLGKPNAPGEKVRLDDIPDDQ